MLQNDTSSRYLHPANNGNGTAWYVGHILELRSAPFARIANISPNHADVRPIIH